MALNGGRLVQLHRDWAVIDVPVNRSERVFYRRNVDVAKIKDWESGLLEFMRAQHPEIADEIRTKRALSDDLTGRLRKAIEEYKAL